MAEKQRSAVNANAYGLKREEVLKSYQKLGDMGLVASDLSQNSKFKIPKVRDSVDEVSKLF